MKLVIKLGTPYVCNFGDEYFEVDEKWEEESKSLEDARATIKTKYNDNFSLWYEVTK